MSTRKTDDAWVALPEEEDLRTVMPAGHPYDFGFLPAMARLAMAHDEIGAAFGGLFASIMFAPGHLDRRERRERAHPYSAKV